MDPHLNPTGARIAGGHPRDESIVRPHECIAARNARELAEHLGHCDTKDSWPIYDGVMYIPVGNHTHYLIEIHIDKLPLCKPIGQLPVGETTNVAEVAEKVEKLLDVETAEVAVASYPQKSKRRRRNRTA